MTIFKKGDKADCGNYRGISLLAIAGKILAKVLLNRLLPIAEDFLPETQCGFRPTRGTTDMIFTIRLLQEKCREQHQPLYMAFFDLSKAFDSISRTALWKILLKFGCPQKFVSILQLLHDEMQAVILNNDDMTEPVHIRTGVKQGCVIAPTLFSIFLTAMLHLTTENIPNGIQLVYRMDSKLFNLSCLRAKRKTNITSVVELQYADDAAVCACSEQELQSIVDIFTQSYSHLGLKLNTQKTKVLFQPAPGATCAEPSITAIGDILENLESFPYLGSLLLVKADIDEEVKHRIACASIAFGKLRQRVFEDRDLKNSTKLAVYNAMIIPALLYGAETWTPYRRHLKQLESFHQRHLRRILGVTWQDKRTNISILQEASTSSIEAMVAHKQLRWTGHVV